MLNLTVALGVIVQIIEFSPLRVQAAHSIV